jgi:hypothetical protein
MKGSFPLSGRENPSAWQRRVAVVVLALVGLVIASYLALFQFGLLARVWEPFFGDGSRIILRQSAISRLLPIPDAALGAIVYLVEAVLECVGGGRRWRDRPGAVYATGAVAGALVLAAVVLVACQVFWFRAYCTLCLGSAACSFAIAVLVAPEVRAAVRYRSQFTEAGEVKP